MQNADQFLSDAADDVGIDRTFFAIWVSSGAELLKFPLHQVIGSTLLEVSQASLFAKTPFFSL